MPSVDTACFDSLNNDCLVYILIYLEVEDMNTLAICSQDCREARSNESLDQTRTGTIVCSQNTTIQSLYRIMATCEQNNIFYGNRTHLKIENITMFHSISFFPPIMTGVLSLDLSCRPANNGTIGHQALEILRAVPNVTKIDLSHLALYAPWGSLRFASCSRLKQLSLTNSDGFVPMAGTSLRGCHGLTDLFLDHSRLFSSHVAGLAQVVAIFYETAGDFDPQQQQHLLKFCPNIERLSMKGATWCVGDRPAETHPVSQRMLIKMVRNLPRLQWLRSDLSEENIATLNAERPEITFVSA